MRRFYRMEGSMQDETIQCRAQLEADCFHGASMAEQMPGEESPVTMAEDGTYNGATIVCDPCYVRLMPFTRSGQALNDEIPEAVRHYKNNRDYVRQHADPAELVEEAQRTIDDARPYSPRWSSATAAKKMAQAELDRRVAA